MSQEEWRACPSWPGYWVSNEGRVKSRYRIRVLHPDKDGHMKALVCINGKRSNVSVHRMVCEAFNGPAPKGAVCRHLNGIPDDNRPENLRWGTVKENSADSILHGTQIGGANHHAAKLSDEQIADIKKRAATGVRGIGRQLAREYGITAAYVCRINKGKDRRSPKLPT